MIAETPDEFQALQEKCRVERSMGLESEILTGADLRADYPHLSPHLLVADFCADEGYANPLLVAPAYSRGALAAGADIRLQTEVRQIQELPSRGVDVIFAQRGIR